MTPAAARAMYRALLVPGDTVSLVRGFGTAAPDQVDGLPARMLKASELLVAGLMQGERVLLLSRGFDSPREAGQCVAAMKTGDLEGRGGDFRLGEGVDTDEVNRALAAFLADALD